MYTNIRTTTVYAPHISILNKNFVPKDKCAPAIQAMGMSACQARCLRCNKCSDNHCGNRC